MIENNLMPPWNISKHTGPWENVSNLNSEEKEMILKWVDEGLPYKNKNLKLFPTQKTTKKIKNPDHIIKLDKPVKIPATGFMPYVRLISVPRFSEDKYLKDVEFIVKSKVIHHIIIFILNKNLLLQIKKKPNEMRHKAERVIMGWAVGEEKLRKLDQNIGIKIPKNSAFIVRIHYEPIGQKLIDTETQIKFKFHSKPPKYLLFKDKVSDLHLNIPPYQNNYKSELYYKLKEDKLLKTMGAHMHARGKSSSISIQDPKGNEIEIFRLNPYFFNFQKDFFLKKALKIPKGYSLVCRNYFDNSADNPANPDPSKTVKKGLYAEDEMSECYFSFLIPSS